MNRLLYERHKWQFGPVSFQPKSTKMNSTNGSPQSEVNEESNATSSTSDSNAKLSRGAIPKTKPPKKTNNNIDELAEILKKNGFKPAPSNYLDSDPDNENATLKPVLQLPPEKTCLNIPVEQRVQNGYQNMASAHNFPDDGKDGHSSSDDNELLSISDDGCIYTYKGDQVADLPSSFFNLEVGGGDEVGNNGREENSSPEMDFLEMDFDPGPSGDADSDSISNTEIDKAANLPLDGVPITPEPQPCCSKDLNQESAEADHNKDEPTPSKYLNIAKVIPEPVSYPAPSPKSEIPMPWSCSLADRTRNPKNLRVMMRSHNARGELSSNEIVIHGDVCILNLSCFHTATGKILDEKNSVAEPTEKNMIWTPHEACLKQITQVGPSACGATAVLNTLNALKFATPTMERVQECVQTRLRANSSGLTEYLLSRSNAGCTHRDIIAGLYTLSERRLYARFFAMCPERVVNLQSWLGYWIKNGAVPIATLNLQKCEGQLPDSWHHQMIFGVGPEGVYLTNPLECVDAAQLWPQVSSESVLLVRVADVVSRWEPKDIAELMKIDDVRWTELNVVGQVAKVIRESRRETHVDATTHIKIPAEYKAGITLVLDMNSPAFSLLRQCPELPLLQPIYSASAL